MPDFAEQEIATALVIARSCIRVTLMSGNVKRRRTLEQAVVEAVEREHKRFASDLHDGICQELAGIAMMLDAIRGHVTADAATEIRSICDHIRRVTIDARRLALGLAPIAVDRSGLAGALRLLKQDLDTLRGPTIAVTVDERISRELPLDRAVNLYRIVQEATANALRHSGASHIDISVESTDRGLSLVIQDDGCGIPDGAGKLSGLGIKSMMSRAEWLGGKISLMRTSPRGTRVQITVLTDFEC
jgi:signal transduction histidine kinase